MPTNPEPTPSALIDARIAELADWRGETLARVRALIHAAVPDVIETWKWRGVPVWEHDGILCTGETYKAVVKMTFAKLAKILTDDQRDQLKQMRNRGPRGPGGPNGPGGRNDFGPGPPPSGRPPSEPRPEREE